MAVIRERQDARDLQLESSRCPGTSPSLGFVDELRGMRALFIRVRRVEGYVPTHH
jgi:hypothetical protein